MQKSLLFSMAFTFALLNGCNDDNNSENRTEQSPLVGLWVTESCEHVEQEESNTTQIWAKGSYEFTSFGAMYMEPKAYYDSDCTRPRPQANDPAPIHLYQPDTYQDLGETMLQEGIIGRSLIIEFNFDGVKYPIDAYFTINQDRLCFSEVLILEALRFGFENDGSTDIDFEACLIRS
ncbi:MAG: hypothetical protein JAY90_18965 [Candidatus Thiodiazotropha lotti]|nr:hypothetical protein [Candidatus Thiodiazotropha lotti]